MIIVFLSVIVVDSKNSFFSWVLTFKFKLNITYPLRKKKVFFCLPDMHLHNDPPLSHYKKKHD